MKQQPKRLIVANAFGTLGYISIIFQWLWSFLILVYPVLIAQPDFLFPADQPTFVQDNTAVAASPLVVAIALAATVVIMAITAVVLFRLPKTIGKKGAHITKSAASTVIPVVTHHKKLSKKKRIQLSYQIILGIKLLLIVAPLFALPFAQPIEQIGTEVIWAMALFCATCSTSYFLLQQIIARVTRVDTEKLW